jgi:hypothetical protein
VTHPLVTLRRFVRARPAPREQCELCGAPLAPEHPHLLEVARRQLRCACAPCTEIASLPDAARFRLVPRRVLLLEGFRLSDAQWESLLLPIDLAFLVDSTAAAKVVAIYPSPAGPMESLLALSAWREILGENPILRTLTPDVEALLVNHVRGARDHYLVPIDECYRLVGLIRTRWRGLSGGAEAWRGIGELFAALRARAERERGEPNA